jgi:hypothetical protein
MGWDLTMLPVRLNSAPLSTIRRDALLWETAIDFPPFFEDEGEPLPEVNRQILVDRPAGLGWNDPFLDRSHEQAEYLLDPAGHRRLTSWEERERTLPYRIVHGDQEFAEHAKAPQGNPWRCSTAAFLADSAATIDGLDVAAVRREFSVAEMANGGVYRVRRGEGDDEAFDRVLAHLRELARYYHRVVDLGFDLIVVLD